MIDQTECGCHPEGGEGDEGDPRLGSLHPHESGNLVYLLSYSIPSFLKSFRQRVGPQQVFAECVDE